MFELLKRWGKDATIRARTKDWKKPVTWNNHPWVCPVCGHAMTEEESKGYRSCPTGVHFARHRRARVFPSLCDWLDDEVPIEWLSDFLKLIHDTPNLDWLNLTKRPELFFPRLRLALEYVDKKLSTGYGNAETSQVGDDGKRHCGKVRNDEKGNQFHHDRKDLEAFASWLKNWLSGNPPPNVWLGVSVEDQKRAEERIPLLLGIPAKIHFLSVEPLLENVNLQGWLNVQSARDGSQIDFVIVGGESGPKRRDCGIEAICDMARQCVAAGVPVFVKQDCQRLPGQQGRLPQEIWDLKQFPQTEPELLPPATPCPTPASPVPDPIDTAH